MSVFMTLWLIIIGKTEVMMKTKYTKLKKSRLPNHKLFDPQKENQREDYFYSLILLFVPLEMRVVYCSKMKQQRKPSTD